MARLKMLQPRLRAIDTRSVKPPPKVGLPFYSTPEWIALRDRVRAEAKGRCEKPGCNRPGHIVDHIVEIRDGGAPLDRANCWLLCQPHHVEKTNTERARRAARRYS